MESRIGMSLSMSAPQPMWASFGRLDIWLAALALAATQIPLTFGNAILGVVAETRRFFPTARIDETSVARSTGLMNLLAAGLGAPPMCHGAGGLAAHVTFCARTGRAPMLLGFSLILFAAPYVTDFLNIPPDGTLGAVLFVTGLSLAIGTAGSARDKEARAVLLLTAVMASGVP